MKSKIEIEKGNLKMENENRNQEFKMGDWIKSKDGIGRVFCKSLNGSYGARFFIKNYDADDYHDCKILALDWGYENREALKEGKDCRWAYEPKRIYPSIKIFTDGKTVTAQYMVGKEILKTAKAVCSPNDEFDYDVGADLALKRLRHEDWLVEMENENTEVENEPEIENENCEQIGEFDWETGNGFLRRKFDISEDYYKGGKVYMFMNFHTVSERGTYGPEFKDKQAVIEWLHDCFEEI